MRTPLIILLGGLLVILLAFGVFAQEGESDAVPKAQLYHVHVDHVKPSMVAKYEAAAKAFVAQLTEHNVADFSYMTGMREDFQYWYLSKLDNYAQLDENPLADMQSKMGDEAWQKMWSGFDECYHKHESFTISLSKELSYDPSDAEIMQEGTPFRDMQYFYVTPGNGGKAAEISKRWKALYEEKKIPHGYRLYWGGLGTETPLVIVVQWDKNNASFQARDAKVNEMLGEQGQNLMKETMELVHKYERVSSMMRPDLSYIPTSGMTTK